MIHVSYEDAQPTLHCMQVSNREEDQAQLYRTIQHNIKLECGGANDDANFFAISCRMKLKISMT